MKNCKLILWFLAAFMVLSVLVSCGEAAMETEGKASETVAVTETEGHVHASAKDPIRVKDSTCSLAGYYDYRCDECDSVYRVDLPLTGHSYHAQTDPDSGFEEQVCNGCGDELIRLEGAKSLEFSAFCSGDVCVDVESHGDGAEIELFVDGESVSRQTYAKGMEKLFFEWDIAEGEHTFKLVCHTAEAVVDLRNLQVNGSYNRPNALILETKPATAGKGQYASFYIYVQTSDPSGEYYIRYNMEYEYNIEAWGEADSTQNIESFRVKGANLVRVKSVSDTAVSYDTICRVLHTGEISLAVKEKNAADFIGGLHGDEHIESFSLKADGVSYTPGAEKKAVRCSYIQFDQTTVLNRCNMPGDNVIRHVQHFLIDSSGFHAQKEVEWLTDSFNPQHVYLQMFTMYRVDKGKMICETFETLDFNGKSLAKDTVTTEILDDVQYLNSPANRGVRYSSATSGVSSEVRFWIVDNSVAFKNGRIAVRAVGDNKWYADFIPTGGKAKPSSGDVWKVETWFNIDYVTPSTAQ